MGITVFSSDQFPYVICTSTTRPAPFEGLQIYETNTKRTYLYSGGTWVAMSATGAWLPYTSTANDVGITGGTRTCAYMRFGSTCFFRWQIVLTGANFSAGTIQCGLPFTAAAAGQTVAGTAADVSAITSIPIVGRIDSGATAAYPLQDRVGGGTVNSTQPWTWASTDWLYISGAYEIA